MIDPQTLKTEIIAHLEAEELSEEEQEILIASLTDALIERATLMLMSELPAEVLVQLESDPAKYDNPEEMFAVFQEHISDIESVTQRAFAEGIAAYKEGLRS